VVEAALTSDAAGRGAARWRTSLAAVVLVLLLGALTATGRWPELRSKVSFAPKGLVSIAAADITRVEVRSGSDSVALHRAPGGWVIEGTQNAVPS
jgi:hypothetical protein